jgi:hypothetical protein
MAVNLVRLMGRRQLHLHGYARILMAGERRQAARGGRIIL